LQPASSSSSRSVAASFVRHRTSVRNGCDLQPASPACYSSSEEVSIFLSTSIFSSSCYVFIVLNFLITWNGTSFAVCSFLNIATDEF